MSDAPSGAQAQSLALHSGQGTFCWSLRTIMQALLCDPARELCWGGGWEPMPPTAGSEPTALLALPVPEDTHSQNPESLESRETYLPLEAKEAQKASSNSALQPQIALLLLPHPRAPTEGGHGCERPLFNKIFFPKPRETRLGPEWCHMSCCGD